MKRSQFEPRGNIFFLSRVDSKDRILCFNNQLRNYGVINLHLKCQSRLQQTTFINIFSLFFSENKT